jgi:hypothetical protein
MNAKSYKKTEDSFRICPSFKGHFKGGYYQGALCYITVKKTYIFHTSYCRLALRERGILLVNREKCQKEEHQSGMRVTS